MFWKPKFRMFRNPRGQGHWESAKAVIARRIDLYGISESVVQTAISKDAYRLIVELPNH